MENVEKGQYALSIFRLLIGWLFIWGFLDKMFGLGFETPPEGAWINGGSPSSYVVWVTKGVFADLFNSMAGNAFIDVLFMAGLLIIGITLILGIATKLTTIFSIVFFIVMYCLCVPPTDNPLIDYHILLAVGMVVVYYLGGYEKLSLYDKWKEFPLVKRFPILE